MSALSNGERRELREMLSKCPDGFLNSLILTLPEEIRINEIKVARSKGKLALANRELKRRKRKEIVR